MRILIVEDEVLLAKKLQKLILETEPGVEIAGMTQGIESSTNWLRTNTAPDLIFMDIELCDGQSFEIFSNVDVQSPVIFTTAYDEYAIRAFKVNSVDYLLKPIQPEALRSAIDKFKRLHENKNTAQPDLQEIFTSIKKLQQTQRTYRDRFLVKTGQKMISIDVNDIAYFFSENGMSFLRTKQNQKHAVEYTLDEIESSVSPNLFCRANRQYIISKHSVSAIHIWFNGKLKAELKPEAEEHIIISRDKASSFKSWMGE